MNASGSEARNSKLSQHLHLTEEKWRITKFNMKTVNAGINLDFCSLLKLYFSRYFDGLLHPILHAQFQTSAAFSEKCLAGIS